ncbi:MAG: glycosyltransferase family 39 protein, partial [Thermoanaerobaculia bacterium]|nr:glycosyltransferase family 39 protein [Thermoanaerobaculia bacterium]
MSSRTSQRRLPPAWLLPWGAFAAIVVTWLLDVAGPGVPEPLARAVLIVGLAALLGAAGRAVLGSVRRRGVTGWALLAVTALSLGMKLSTLDFELTTHARNDEGVYREFAEKINEGELLPRYFNYGHLLYYAGALSLWAGEQFPETSALAAEGLYGARTPLEVRRVLLRLITALLAALTVIPVFLAAERLGGPWAGVVGGLLLAASTVHNEVAPQFTADGPSGFFAALAFLYVVKLVEGERLADYLAAGALAGLAAACKYPGGVVTVGIFGVWLFWRVRLRRFSWSLVWAAAACVGALLVVMPALWLTPGAVLDPSQTDGRDLFFGVRQYAFGGWLGVEPESVTLWNLRVLRADLGWPAILFGIGGWFLLDPDRRRRLLVALVFPAAYLALLFAMNMVVRRNLLP